MIGLTLVGCALGATVFYLVLVLRPPAAPPLVMLARFDEARNRSTVIRESSTRPGGVQGRLGELVARELTRRGFRYTSLRQDLALTGQTFEAAMGRKVVAAVAGLLIGLAVCVGMSMAGLGLPAGVPAVIALLVAGGFFFIPDYDARSAAQARRREFRRALGAYLDWVSLQMSGRAAAEQALPDAAKIGAGWPLALIRHTVTNATRSGQDVWTAFTDLGERIGVPQLRELGTLVQLVAHDGAQVRDTLAARAASLRAEELAEAQGSAGKRDQSMLLAQVLLVMGFGVFLAYPAIVNFTRL
ncbi:Flp pilus assembly protein TadB [Jatrophihabitans sp. GAS493]|uniref:type II secretion system protein n=1 Tax=Jatrophihabitans sp. GAS493 TaxID=1907575 RepID=UPI000BB80FCF|nr:type II secretion system protein [Jatrophihabitans sp. GAS493]SOD72946.1 Flp pilus assembly protein TadB [Jatrophihabitans sp. GAS493]